MMIKKFVFAEFLKLIEDQVNRGKVGRALILEIQHLGKVRFVIKRNLARIKVTISEPELDGFGCSWARQAGPYAQFLKKGEYEVKLDMFRSYQMLNRTAIFRSDKLVNEEQYSLIQSDSVKNQEYIDIEKLSKLLSFAMSAKLQNKYLDRLRTLNDSKFFYYYSAWLAKDGKIVDVDPIKVPFAFTNAMSPDHLLKGFFPKKIDLCGYSDTPILKHEFGVEVATIGGVKKALARQKLAYAVNGANIGTYQMFVITDMPDAIKAMHVVGGIYAPKTFFSKYGASRATNEFLLKCVFMPQPELVNQEWGNVLTLGVRSFKGELQGLCEALGVSELAIQKRVFMGHEVEGVYVEMPVVITNLIVAYGISVSQKIKDDPSMLGVFVNDPIYSEFAVLLQNKLASQDSPEMEALDDEDKYQSSSVYLYIIEQLNKNKDFSPVSFIRMGIKRGLFDESDVTTNVKAFDVQNVYSTYGYEIATAFVESVIKNAKSNELNQYLLGQLVTYEIPIDQIEGITKYIFSDPNIMTSKFDPEDLAKKLSGLRAQILSNEFITRYMNGSEFKFNGLLGDQPKTLTIKGYKFYIPSGKVQSNFTYPEVDRIGQLTGRYFFNGPSLLANELFKLIAKYQGKLDEIPEDHVKMFYIYYYAKMQKALYGYYGENIKVRGWSNKMILPCFWSNDTVFCADSRYRSYNNKVVVFSKVPVLFNSAVHGVNYSSRVDEFGEGDSDFWYAMKSCVFVPVSILLAHQNDADGDLGRVMYLHNHGLPVFNGSQLPAYMKDWQKQYENDEYDLNFKIKNYEVEPELAIDIALREAVLAKKTIGRATNLANVIGFLGLSRYGNRFASNRDALVMMVQEIIRSVKHADNKESMLDYLSQISFGQIYGAVTKYWVGDEQFVEDNSAYEVNKLAQKIEEQVGKCDDSLFWLRDDFTCEMVRLTQVKDGQYAYLPKEFKFLNMYIRTWNSAFADRLVYPNYDSYTKYPDSIVRKVYDDLFNQFSEVQDNLLFVSGIGNVSTGGLMYLMYKLLFASK
jgi:hypothetical protein